MIISGNHCVAILLANFGIFLTIDVYFFSVLTPVSLDMRLLVNLSLNA